MNILNNIARCCFSLKISRLWRIQRALKGEGGYCQSCIMFRISWKPSHAQFEMYPKVFPTKPPFYFPFVLFSSFYPFIPPFSTFFSPLSPRKAFIMCGGLWEFIQYTPWIILHLFVVRVIRCWRPPAPTAPPSSSKTSKATYSV